MTEASRVEEALSCASGDGCHMVNSCQEVLAAEVSALKARIREFDKTIDAESRDPNGTIWEASNKFYDDNVRLNGENKALKASANAHRDAQIAAESRCVESQSIHDQQVYSLNNQIARIMWQRDAALARLASAEKVLRSVRGFRDHGEAKNGTHATIMFEDLAAHDAQTGEK